MKYGADINEVVPMKEGAAADSLQSAPETTEEGGGESGGGTLTVDPGMLPQGMDFKPGDIVEFKVVGMNKDGGLEVTYNTGESPAPEGAEKEGAGMSSWEDDFRKEMSPRSDGANMPM